MVARTSIGVDAWASIRIRVVVIIVAQGAAAQLRHQHHCTRCSTIESTTVTDHRAICHIHTCAMSSGVATRPMGCVPALDL